MQVSRPMGVPLLLFFLWTTWGMKVLHEADRLEDLPLFAYDTENDRSLVIRQDLVRNRVLLMKLENGEKGFVPEQVGFIGSGRKMLQDGSSDAEYAELSQILAADNYEPEEPTSSEEEVSSGDANMTAFFGSIPQPELLDFESIVGVDEREFVSDTTRYPYRTIGRILFRCGSGYQACTGTLVGPRAVMTAAHCIYSRDSGRCSDFTFAPGQQKDFKPYGTARGIDTFVPSSYPRNYDINGDYGLIILDSDVGSQVGWMGFGYKCGDTTQDLITAGYPNDKDASSSTMYLARCPNQPINACPCPRGSFSCPSGNTFKHTCDTFSGQSGSPIWTELSDGFPQIRGVHSSGFVAGSFDQRNSAVFIGTTTFDFFLGNLPTN
eukprot:TRINITY_DN2368_c0_g1_i1.p1 TRINITY_DN2368_c0_g1~~TRINITY_DN2368_c0_g1_i1.p1  ORF type:complete len:422 (+),score=43.62 TRINITY_DN2368_c0_g1_i1:130-1266(+)